MFWKTRKSADVANLSAGEIVSRVSEIYADLNEQDCLIKPQSKLPCSWFGARESFMVAYQTEYLNLSEELRHGYHHIYRELAFFVDDDLCEQFNASLDVAVRCRSERLKEIRVFEEETRSRNKIASQSVKMQNRKEIWEGLAHEKTCPRNDLLVLTEILAYCAGLHRAMWDEWAAFANLIACRKKMQ
jgi:hypothetical protein